TKNIKLSKKEKIRNKVHEDINIK